jgi:hypothetical protein
VAIGAQVSGKRPISGSSRAFPFGRWVSALVFAGMGAGIYLAKSPLPTASQQNMLLMAVAVTGLIALGTFWQATYDTLRHFRYRGLGLELTPETAVAKRFRHLLVPVPFRRGDFKVLSGAELRGPLPERNRDSTAINTIRANSWRRVQRSLRPLALVRCHARLPPAADAQEPRLRRAGKWTDSTADRVT